MYNNTIGVSNTAIGVVAGNQNTTGNYNTYIGDESGYSNQTTSNNTAVGYQALNSNNIGTNNSALGYRAGALITNGSNVTYIGANTTATVSNSVRIGDSNVTTVTCQPNAWSDQRDKEDIRDTILGLDFINKIRPVDYKWDFREDYRTQIPNRNDFENDDLFNQAIGDWKEQNKLCNIIKDGSKKRTRYHHGVLAQQLQQVIQETGIDFGGFQDHSIKGWEEAMTIGYNEFIGPMIKAIQELSKKNQELENKIVILEGKIN